MSLFCRTAPKAQIYVNGEPVIFIGGEKQMKSWTRHSAGNIGGLSLIDFVALPARARVSIGLTFEGSVEGFLGMRKL